MSATGGPPGGYGRPYPSGGAAGGWGLPGQPGQPGQPAAGQPVCPRHPDRVSYVTCQRCGRPVCAECQRPATVGVHCVDCVREAARNRPVARTVFGGVSRPGRLVVTLTIIVACTALELLRYLAPDVYAEVFRQLVFAPRFGLTDPYRFFTATLLHGGILHLAFNMYALWLMGTQLEPALGRLRFATLYVLSALGGTVGYLVIAGPNAPAVVGASGAVFGLFAAFAVLLRRLGRDARGILVVIALNLVLGFVVAGVAWQAHLGGLVVGAVLGLIFGYLPVHRTPRSSTRPTANQPGALASPRASLTSGATLQWLAVAGVAVVLVAVAVLVSG